MSEPEKLSPLALIGAARVELNKIKNHPHEIKYTYPSSEDDTDKIIERGLDAARDVVLSGVYGRRYFPTMAELIDRLSICILKKIYISENASEYQKEIDAIKHDINLLQNVKDGMQLFDADMLEATMIVMLSNRVIWENESKARLGGDSQDAYLKFTHSINGVRNTAKNIISSNFDDRKDLKVDCLASNIPVEFGNWNIFTTTKKEENE